MNCEKCIGINIIKPDLSYLNKTYSIEYLKWRKQSNLPSLTNTQYRFVEFLFNNKEHIPHIGNVEIIFKSIRKYLKS